MKQLRLPPPWGPIVIDLFAKIVREQKEGIKHNYHFCGRKLGR